MSPGSTSRALRVWLDLSNSPHPLLFGPVVRRLEAEGDEVLITVRNHGQTIALTGERWNDFRVIGGESPAGRVAKGRVLAARVRGLHEWARRSRPDVALSHNSYAQIVAARMARVPAVTAMDFEYQPANHLAFRLATLILLPQAVPQEVVRGQGARPAKLRRYPGLKEGLYIGDFEPDPGVLAELGIERGSRGPLVVLRTPPSRALYHRFDNPLFGHVLDEIGRQPEVVCVALTRTRDQDAAIARRGLPNIILPSGPIDSRSLMYEADLMIGAGGTMTREAALMGIPTLSIFAGRQPAVDRWLESTGALELMAAPQRIAAIERRASEPTTVQELKDMGEPGVERFVAAVREAVSWPRGPGARRAPSSTAA